MRKILIALFTLIPLLSYSDIVVEKTSRLSYTASRGSNDWVLSIPINAKYLLQATACTSGTQIMSGYVNKTLFIRPLRQDTSFTVAYQIAPKDSNALYITNRTFTIHEGDTSQVAFGISPCDTLPFAPYFRFIVTAGAGASTDSIRATVRVLEY